jgi:hypothetical protein
MTHFISQADLEKLNETELRWMLRDAFNKLAAQKKSSPECEDAAASIEAIQKALRGKANTPKP